jgi:hypothetical protein
MQSKIAKTWKILKFLRFGRKNIQILRFEKNFKIHEKIYKILRKNARNSGFCKEQQNFLVSKRTRHDSQSLQKRQKRKLKVRSQKTQCCLDKALIIQKPLIRRSIRRGSVHKNF